MFVLWGGQKADLEKLGGGGSEKGKTMNEVEWNRGNIGNTVDLVYDLSQYHSLPLLTSDKNICLCWLGTEFI